MVEGRGLNSLELNCRDFPLGIFMLRSRDKLNGNLVIVAVFSKSGTLS